MARIWYSVQGDGMGHAVRSSVIIDYLSKRNDLLITVTREGPFKYLNEKYGDSVKLIEGDAFVYENNTVKIAKSIKEFFSNLPRGTKQNARILSRLVLDFKPDLLISDFEPASKYFAKLIGLPIISIDNIHTLSQCKVKKPKDTKYGAWLAKTLIRILHPPSDYYVIPAFADLKPKDKKTFIVKPIVRKDVLKLKPETKNFVLVYQTSPSNTKMLSILKASDTNFKVYGMKKQKISKNIEFKKFSSTGFLEDLRTCKYVIINGGFTVLSESIYLEKPVLAIPVLNQYEQEFNAFSISEKGYGNYTRDFKRSDLELMEASLKKYKQNLSKFKRGDNKETFVLIDRLINKSIKYKKPKYKLLEILVKKRW